MKVRCEVNLNTDSGEYEIRFWNMTSPGSDIEYNEIQSMLKSIFIDVDKDIMSSGDEDERVLKVIH